MERKKKHKKLAQVFKGIFKRRGSEVGQGAARDLQSEVERHLPLGDSHL